MKTRSRASKASSSSQQTAKYSLRARSILNPVLIDIPWNALCRFDIFGPDDLVNELKSELNNTISFVDGTRPILPSGSTRASNLWHALSISVFHAFGVYKTPRDLFSILGTKDYNSRLYKQDSSFRDQYTGHWNRTSNGHLYQALNVLKGLEGELGTTLQLCVIRETCETQKGKAEEPCDHAMSSGQAVQVMRHELELYDFSSSSATAKAKPSRSAGAAQGRKTIFIYANSVPYGAGLSNFAGFCDPNTVTREVLGLHHDNWKAPNCLMEPEGVAWGPEKHLHYEALLRTLNI